MQWEYTNELERVPARRKDTEAELVPFRVNRPEPLEDEPSKLGEYANLLRWRKWTILFLGLLGAAAGGALFFVEKPKYRVVTILEIQSPNEHFMNRSALDPKAPERAESAQQYLQTKLRTLQGRSLLLRTVAGIRERSVAGSTAPKWAKAGEIENSDPPANSDELIRTVSKDLSVRLMEETRLMEIAFESIDPQFSAAFVKALVGEFVESEVESYSQSADSTSRELVHQLEQIKKKLQDSEVQLQSYAQRAGLLFTFHSENMDEPRVRQAQMELEQARSQRIAKQSRNEQVATASPDSLPEVLGDASMKDLRSRISLLKQQLAELTTTYSASHYKVKQVQAQIQELETGYRAQRENMLKLIHNEYAAALRREELLTQSYAVGTKDLFQQSSRAIQYNILKREVDTNRQLYDSTLQTVKEAGVLSAVRPNYVRVIDPALAPSMPSRPKLLTNTGAGLLAGLFCGVVLVFVRERPGRHFHKLEQASLFLRVPQLGTIPSHSADFSRRPESGTLKLAWSHDSGTPHQELVTALEQTSLLSESCEAVMASILFATSDQRKGSTVVVTSPVAGDGKTSTTVHLGIALAKSGRRTLLIDGDLRRPRLHELFDVTNELGLRQLLTEDPGFTKPRVTSIPNLSVLTSGGVDPNPTPLIFSRRLPALLEALQMGYDIILVDTPPTGLFADARSWAQSALGVVLVVRAGRTDRQDAKTTCQRFAQDGSAVIGVVLNDWNPSHDGSKDYASSYKSYCQQAAE